MIVGCAKCPRTVRNIGEGRVVVPRLQLSASRGGARPPTFGFKVGVGPEATSPGFWSRGTTSGYFLLSLWRVSTLRRGFLPQVGYLTRLHPPMCGATSPDLRVD